MLIWKQFPSIIPTLLIMLWRQPNMCFPKYFFTLWLGCCYTIIFFLSYCHSAFFCVNTSIDWLLERYYRLYSTNKIEGWYWRQDRYDVSMIVGVSDSSQCYPSAGERMRESLENWVADDNVSTSVLQHTLHTLMITSCRGLDRDHLWSSMGGRSIGW